MVSFFPPQSGLGRQSSSFRSRRHHPYPEDIHVSASRHCVISPSFEMDTCQYALNCWVTGARVAEGQRMQAHSQQALARKDGTLKLGH